MPSYLVMGTYTDQGVRTIKESPKRFEMVKHVVQQAGGRVIFFYLTFGQYDFATLFELPNDEAAAKLALTIASQGNVRTTTMKAFTEDEYKKIVGGLP